MNGEQIKEGRRCQRLHKSELLTGTVKFFLSRHGFGFVVPDRHLKGIPKGKPRDVFIHHTNGFDQTEPDGQHIVFKKTGGWIDARENDRVVFQVSVSAKGASASSWAVCNNCNLGL